MKNKKLLITLVALVIIVAGAIVVPKLSSDKKDKSVDSKNLQVGVLQFVTHPALDEIYKGVQDGLSDEGFKDVKINFLNGEADQSKLQTMSKELVSQKNDVLVGIATPSAQSLANATDTIPIVMGAVSDPVGAKLVSNLKKPDKNVTGVSDKFPIDKQLDLMRQILPELKTVGVLYSSSEDNSKSQVAEFKKAAEAAGIQVVEYAVPSTNEISSTVEVAVGKVDAIYTPMDNTIASAFPTVISVANKAKKPVFPSVDTMVEQGGLAAVAINQHDLGVATGKMAAKILNGEKVADIPVEEFSKVKPIINENAAKELGINIPDSVAKDADKVK
ncbi:tryptophan ABC transporter substrate-binding protein [Floricoccus penangensis]|uniref:tryptophan ABC transporter substrate-binding protein n=1 Tax=Floricoccus penangensis TaxID=1859475 RepID=UPI00203F15FA|nr:tryptophan ABC transporter substrate-binding protein [Floricoccus penangensis]URZ86510.1 ABC transporter substrate-binding protein [Floricoccus penangensis]